MTDRSAARKLVHFLRSVVRVYCSRDVLLLLGEMRRVLRAPKLLKSPGAEAQTTALPGSDGFRAKPHNGSIVRHGDAWLVAVRTANVRRSRIFHRLTVEGGPSNVDSATWLLHLDDALHASRGTRLQDGAMRAAHPEARNGFSDARLFRWRDALWALWSAERVPNDDWIGTTNTMALGRVRDDAIEEVRMLPSPRGAMREKNWMPWVLGDQLRVVYTVAPLAVYVVEPDRLRPLPTTGTETAALRGYSGGSQVLPWGDDWLCVVHYAARTLRRGSAELLPSFYLHRFVVLREDCSIGAVSREFFLERRGTEFCAGLATDGEHVLLSYGVDDAASRVLRLPRSTVVALLG
jgi:hypothetical protein